MSSRPLRIATAARRSGASLSVIVARITPPLASSVITPSSTVSARLPPVLLVSVNRALEVALKLSLSPPRLSARLRLSPLTVRAALRRFPRGPYTFEVRITGPKSTLAAVQASRALIMMSAEAPRLARGSFEGLKLSAASCARSASLVS